MSVSRQKMIYSASRWCTNAATRQSKNGDLRFVPVSAQPQDNDIEKLNNFVSNSSRLLVITGAGVSTESGIPDYRSEGVGLYARSSTRPVQYADFLKSKKIRQRYWARNFIGWPRFSSFLPNAVHQSFSRWEKDGLLHWLVTQNVDALHLKAGSKNVTELHGSAHRVECISCKKVISRRDFQKELTDLNPQFEYKSIAVNPDGDVDLTQDQVNRFCVSSCKKCGGPMKPQLVFFGDNVNKDTVELVYDKINSCDSILVARSSLEVFSGYRFVNRAASQNKPIAIVNIGQTRADKLATLKVNARCGLVIPQVSYNKISFFTPKH